MEPPLHTVFFHDSFLLSVKFGLKHYIYLHHNAKKLHIFSGNAQVLLCNYIRLLYIYIHKIQRQNNDFQFKFYCLFSFYPPSVFSLFTLTFCFSPSVPSLRPLLAFSLFSIYHSLDSFLCLFFSFLHLSPTPFLCLSISPPSTLFLLPFLYLLYAVLPSRHRTIPSIFAVDNRMPGPRLLRSPPMTLFLPFVQSSAISPRHGLSSGNAVMCTACFYVYLPLHAVVHLHL